MVHVGYSRRFFFGGANDAPAGGRNPSVSAGLAVCYEGYAVDVIFGGSVDCICYPLLYCILRGTMPVETKVS